ALLAEPALAEAAVVLREDEPGQQRLIAYLVARNGAAPTPAQLRERLAAQLPAYMLPAAYVSLPALPLTPNGKLDRRALPAPTSSDSSNAAAYAAPRDRLELELVELWQQLLHLQPIGIEDNFFTLGGNSLQVL